MGPATVSTEVEETSALNYKTLIGQSIILIVISSIVDGSPFLLLNSAMVVATCVLLKEILHKSLAQSSHVLPPTDVGQAITTDCETAAALPNIHQTTNQLPPSSAKSPHVVPAAHVGQGVLQKRETATALPIATSSKSKYSRQKKPTRDYQPMRFSNSLSLREARYFYDTREVESSGVTPKPISKDAATDEKVKEVIKEPRAKHLHGSLNKVIANTTPPLPPSSRIVEDFARDTPSRAASTTLAKSALVEVTKEPRAKHLHKSLGKAMASSTPPLLSAPRIAKDLAGKVHDTPSHASSTSLAKSALLEVTLDADDEVWWYDARLF